MGEFQKEKTRELKKLLARLDDGFFNRFFQQVDFV
jgi:hypothetical protein